MVRWIWKWFQPPEKLVLSSTTWEKKTRPSSDLDIFLYQPSEPASKPLHRFMPRKFTPDSTLWDWQCGVSSNFLWQCVKTLYPFCSHQNSWDLWMFIPLKMVLIGIDPYPYGISMGFQCRWSRRFRAQFCQRNPSKIPTISPMVKVEKNPWPPKQQRKSKTGWWYT